MEMQTITNQVKQILEKYPLTRNSDDLLYATLCSEINPSVAGMPFYYVMQHRKEFKFPNIKSVERCRRKLQNKYPELAASKEVKDFRDENEQKFREFVKR